MQRTWMINNSSLLNWFCITLFPLTGVAEKVFKSKSQSQVLGLGGGVRPKDVRDRTILELSLRVELNVTRRKNEVLSDRLATVEAKNENSQNYMDPIETKMMKIKDLAFQQFTLLHHCTRWTWNSRFKLNFNFYIVHW